MKIAVVTGASSGMGREFALKIDKSGLDELWVIARRKERLESLQAEIDIPVRAISLDLTDELSYSEYATLLKEASPDVKMLVNCSGYGKFGTYEDVPLEDCNGMIDLNCKALVNITQLTLPYMSEGASILNLDSLSAFQPVPYLNVYAATKAFVLSYSRGLCMELKPRGIHCMAVCPGWVKTEFFDRAETTNNGRVNYFNRTYTATQVVDRALKDLKKKKQVSVCGLPIRNQVRLVKLLPHSLVMKIWCSQQQNKKKSR
ncbi:MAG: SDR family NAD(P)-dependent oxidoreductase [Clostridia bacterium]|nr:SDR family NAD(P)-dependent oxidoreductase [Clostridia bacterium]